jgi:hypothetical protein
MAVESARIGIHTIYMGRGSSNYKESMKSYDVFVAEGIVTSRSMLGMTHRIRTSSTRRVADVVHQHPNLNDAARKIRHLAGRTYGRI